MFPVGLLVNAREIVLIAHLRRLLKILNVRFVLKRSCSNHVRPCVCRGGGLVVENNQIRCVIVWHGLGSVHLRMQRPVVFSTTT